MEGRGRVNVRTLLLLSLLPLLQYISIGGDDKVYDRHHFLPVAQREVDGDLHPVPLCFIITIHGRCSHACGYGGGKQSGEEKGGRETRHYMFSPECGCMETRSRIRIVRQRQADHIAAPGDGGGDDDGHDDDDDVDDDDDGLDDDAIIIERNSPAGAIWTAISIITSCYSSKLARYSGMFLLSTL